MMSDLRRPIGYTDGFYIGAPLPLGRVLSRFRDDALFQTVKRSHGLASGSHDFEDQLKKAFRLHGIERWPTPMYFFKGKSQSQGPNPRVVRRARARACIV